VGGLIRPTLVFYGIATTILAVWIMIFHNDGLVPDRQPGQPRLVFDRIRLAVRGSSVSLLTGLFLFAAGGGVLFLTNYLRFGNGWEFGHRLNLSPVLPLLYSTRFDNPFGQVPVTDGARELFGALFLVKDFNSTEWYQQGIFPGQSPVIRFRNINLTAYDLTYAFLLGLIVIIAVHAGWKWRRAATSGSAREFKLRLPYLLILWSALSCVPLAAFYLRTPAIGARYMLDFSPGFTAALAGFWWLLVEKLAKYPRYTSGILWLLCVVLASWQIWELYKCRSGVSRPDSITGDDGDAFLHTNSQQRIPQAPAEGYRVGDSSWDPDIPYNGVGWDSTTGRLGPCAVFFVESPSFLELQLLDTRATSSKENLQTEIRVKIGLEFLEPISVSRTNDLWVARFRGPRQSQYRKGLQTLFVAAVRPEQLNAFEPSPWILRSLKWEKQNVPRESSPLSIGSSY
jgi:hypothetical protein